MGFWSSLFGSGTTPEEDVQREIQQAVPRTPRGGIMGAVLGQDPKFQKGVGYAIRRAQKNQYYEHERQEREMERQHHDIQRPEYARYWDRALLLSDTQKQVADLKARNDPYAATVEYNLKYLQQQYDNHMGDYDMQWQRQTYDRKYAFQQQQKDYSKQTYEQAYKQLEASRKEHAKRQAISQAMHTQSNIGRGGRGEQPLGRGQKFSRFAPPQARGSFGRKSPRPSFTRPSG